MFERLCISLVLSSTVFGISIIDNANRFDVFMEDDSVSGLGENDIGENDGECSNLSQNLIDEIQSHQPIVNQIVDAVVNGKYSGDTWNA